MPTAPSCPRMILKNDDSLLKSQQWCQVGMLLIWNVALSCVDVVNDKNVSDKQGQDRIDIGWFIEHGPKEAQD